MTVVGPIAGVVDGKVGSTPYKFMLMNATGYKRWNVVQQVVMPPQPIDRGCWVRAPGATAMAAGAGTIPALLR